MAKAKAVKAPEAPAVDPVAKVKNPHTCWKGIICFGLIPVPVKFHTGARPDKSLGFNQLHDACKGRLKQQMICPACDGVVVEAANILKGYERNEGEYIIVTKDELASCQPETAKEITIEKFVKLDTLDPLLFEDNFYLGPDQGGERGWNLVRLALKRSGYAAIAKVAMDEREHLIVIRPFGDGMMVHKMFYQNEVKAMTFPHGLPEPKPGELDVAQQLIEAYAGTFNHADYSDSYATNVRAMLAEKASGKTVTMKAPAPKKPAAGDDMLALLKASLAKKGGKKAA